MAGYSGDIDDVLTTPGSTRRIDGMNFTTWDQDHDNNPAGNCADYTTQHGAGYWYNNCTLGEPNGCNAYFRYRTPTRTISLKSCSHDDTQKI